MKILAVTACPLGLAHTYMAAEAFEMACEKAGVSCKVETQGTLGIDNDITSEDVMEASAVILTTDMPLKNVERFDNILKYEVNISRIVKEADVILSEVINAITK